MSYQHVHDAIVAEIQTSTSTMNNLYNEGLSKEIVDKINLVLSYQNGLMFALQRLIEDPLNEQR